MERRPMEKRRMGTTHFKVGGETFGSVTGQFRYDFEVVQFCLEGRQLLLSGSRQLLIDFDEMRQQLAQFLPLHGLHQGCGHETFQAVLSSAQSEMKQHITN